MIAEPLVEAGAIHVNDAEPSPAVTVNPRGADGRPNGVAVTTFDVAPAPDEMSAATRNE